jgi:anti-anti-sigma factor
MSGEFSICTRDLPNLRIVELRGELDIANAQTLTAKLRELEGSMVVIDLAELTFMDSRGIASLIIARKQTRSDDNRFVITRPDRIVRRAFEALGLADWIEELSASWDEPDRRRSIGKRRDPRA